MEEMQARHRKEQRDLTSRVTQKKKQASKKTRKGVNDECERLEAELKERQTQELAAFDIGHVEDRQDREEGQDEAHEEDDGAVRSEQVEAADQKTRNGKEEASSMDVHEDNTTMAVAAEQRSADQQVGTKKQKRNRQKDRLARRAAEQEDIARRAEEEAQNLPDLKQQERQRMLEGMKQHNLVEKEIRADGHCLYSAIADQLDQLNIAIGGPASEQPSLTYRAVRARAADYIDSHPDDFVPFLEEPLPEYLHKIRDTGEWGGQLELMALAKTYGIEINVLQDFGRLEKVESGSGEDKTAWLAYYKHGFGLGEHYNSLRKAG